MCRLQGGHRGVCMDSGLVGYGMSAMEGAGSWRATYCTYTESSYDRGPLRGWGRAGLHSHLLTSMPQKLRHRGEGAPSHACEATAGGRRDVSARRVMRGDGGGSEGTTPLAGTPVQLQLPTVQLHGLWGGRLGQRNGIALVWMKAPPLAHPGPWGRVARVTSWTRGASAQSPAGRDLQQRPGRGPQA